MSGSDLKLQDDGEALRREVLELQKKAALQEATLVELDRAAKGLVRRDFELSQINEQLQEMDRLKSEFVSVAAHQLRTPLSGVKWGLDMLLGGELGATTNEQRMYLLKSYESNNRMIKLVNDLLQVDRIESSHQPFQFTPTNLLDLLDNVLYEVLPEAHQKGIRISFNSRPKVVPLIPIDQEKMRLVFQNLLENAITYTAARGTIEIGIAVEPMELKFSIRDTGIGIPKDQQPYIFSRFFRARNAIKVQTDGSGLGLFIAKRVIEKYAGKLWFSSEEGKGTTFYFTIPISGAKDMTEAKPTQTGQQWPPSVQ